LSGVLRTHAGAVLVAVAALAALAFLYAPFLADDGYITLAFARAFVEDGVPSIGGNAVHALSSPLWFEVAVLAVALCGAAAPTAMKLASLASAALAVGLVGRLAVQRGAAPGGVTLAVVLLVVDPWFGRWAFAGMEAPAALAVVAGALLLHEQGRSAWGALLAGSVGVLLRPELALLAVLLAGVAVRRKEPVQAGRLALAGALAAAPLVVWAVYADGWFGQVLPRTAEVKAGVLGVGSASVRGALVVLTAQAVALGGLAWKRTGALPVAWLGLLLAFYVVRGHEPQSRYLLVALGVLPAYAAGAAPKEAIRWLALAAVALGVAVTVVRAAPASTGDSVAFYREVATWLDEHGAPDDSLATIEIGALGWHADRGLVDLGGLALPPDLAELWPSPRRILRVTRPRYSLQRYDIDGVGWTEVYGRDVTPQVARFGAEQQRWVLWELDWSGRTEP